MQNFHCMWYSCSWSCTAVCPCQVRILARVVDKQLHHSFIKCCPVHGLFSSPGSHPPQPSPHPTTSARGMCSLKMQDDSGPAGNAKRVGASIDADGETFSVLCSPLLAMWVYACVVRMFLHWCVCKRSMCRSLHPRCAQLHEADVCKGIVNMSLIIEDVCTAIYWWYVCSQRCTLCLMQRNKPSVLNVPVSVGTEPLLWLFRTVGSFQIETVARLLTALPYISCKNVEGPALPICPLGTGTKWYKNSPSDHIDPKSSTQPCQVIQPVPHNFERRITSWSIWSCTQDFKYLYRTTHQTFLLNLFTR